MGVCESAPVAAPAAVGALLLSVSMLPGPAHKAIPEVEPMAGPKIQSLARPHDSVPRVSKQSQHPWHQQATCRAWQQMLAARHNGQYTLHA